MQQIYKSDIDFQMEDCTHFIQTKQACQVSLRPLQFANTGVLICMLKKNQDIIVCMFNSFLSLIFFCLVVASQLLTSLICLGWQQEEQQYQQCLFYYSLSFHPSLSCDSPFTMQQQLQFFSAQLYCFDCASPLSSTPSPAAAGSCFLFHPIPLYVTCPAPNIRQTSLILIQFTNMSGHLVLHLSLLLNKPTNKDSLGRSALLTSL